MKKLCALVLTLGLLLTCFTTSVYALDSYADAKIDSNLTAALYESSSDTATAYVTMAGLDEETFMDYFQEHYPADHAVYMYAKYDVEPQLEGLDEITDEMIQNAIETKRAVYKELNSEYSNEIIGRYYDSDEILFVSGYAPVAIVETNQSDLTWLARRSDIDNISYFANDTILASDVEITANPGTWTYDFDNILEGIDLANNISRADIVRDDKGMTGEGVKIGVIEKGIPHTNFTFLSSANITIRPGDTTIDSHATIVTSYLVAAEPNGTVHGIVPDAEIFCCEIDGSASEFLAGIEWLVDQGVNIINASLGGHTASSNNIAYASYDNLSIWIDHLSIQHDVHFVTTAGNYDAPSSENGYINISYRVSSPGMAYNAITVGNFHSNGSSNIDTFTFDGTLSCYIEDSASTYGYRAEKPNLVACGLLKDAIYYHKSQTYGNAFGTSFSAPQVAGVIAQLCDYTSGLKTKQTQMGAILAASSARKVDAVGSGEKGDTFLSGVRVENNPQISNVEGAGILDARWAWGVVVNHNHWSANVEADDFPYTKTVTINTNKFELIRVAIFWPRNVTITDHGSVSTTMSVNPFVDLDLDVYAPDGTLLGSSKLTYANFEIVQFIPPETGEYIIKITGNPSVTTRIGISVW